MVDKKNEPMVRESLHSQGKKWKCNDCGFWSATNTNGLDAFPLATKHVSTTGHGIWQVETIYSYLERESSQ